MNARLRVRPTREGLVALLALVVGVSGLGVGLVRAQRAEAHARQEAETARRIVRRHVRPRRLSTRARWAAEGVAEIATGAEAIGASEVLHAAADATVEEDE